MEIAIGRALWGQEEGCLPKAALRAWHGSEAIAETVQTTHDQWGPFSCSAGMSVD